MTIRMDNQNSHSWWIQPLSQDLEPEPLNEKPQATRQQDPVDMNEGGGRLLSFPHRLHRMLNDVEMQGKQHIVSWMPCGRSFKVHKTAEFVREVAPVYFSLTQYKSFKRQLINYGFVRNQSKRGIAGAFCNPFFVRDDPSKCSLIRRGQSPPQKSAHSDHAVEKKPAASISNTKNAKNNPRQGLQYALDLLVDDALKVMDTENDDIFSSLNSQKDLADLSSYFSDSDTSDDSDMCSIFGSGDDADPLMSDQKSSEASSYPNLSQVLDSYSNGGPQGNDLTKATALNDPSLDYLKYKDEIISLFGSGTNSREAQTGAAHYGIAAGLFHTPRR